MPDMMRWRMLRAAIAAALFLVSGPAMAHRLKLFTSVENGIISGYGFFIGGGRATAASIIFRNSGGIELHRMTVDTKGEFRWKPPRPQDVKVILNAGDGHATETIIAAQRLAASDGPAGGVRHPAQGAASPTTGISAKAPAAISQEQQKQIAALIEKQVDEAVARQIRPLLEAYARAEGRVRFNDIMGGIGMLVGLAGIALWAMGRRRKNRSDAT
jgi:nickel transport protein